MPFSSAAKARLTRCIRNDGDNIRPFSTPSEAIEATTQALNRVQPKNPGMKPITDGQNTFGQSTVDAFSKQTEAPADAAQDPFVLASFGSTKPVPSADLAAVPCQVFNELAPQAPNVSAIDAQAQLVRAIASGFDVHAAALRQVTSEINTVATTSGSASRDVLLKVLKINSLQAAMRSYFMIATVVFL